MTLKSATPSLQGLYVAAYNAPDEYKNGAHYICTGSDDDVEIQAAIDEAEAHSTTWGCQVILSPGTFYLGSTIIAGGSTSDNAGTTIFGSGRGTWLIWDSSNTGNVDNWMMRFTCETAEYSQSPRLNNLIFDGNSKANGLWVGDAAGGSSAPALRTISSNLTFYRCKGFGLYSQLAQESLYQGIYCTYGYGNAVVMGNCWGSRLEHLLVRGYRTNTGSPRHRRYKVDDTSGRFQVHEYISGTGDRLAYILNQGGSADATQYLWVATEYGSGLFNDNAVIIGKDSGASGNIDDDSSETYNLDAGILFSANVSTDDTYLAGPSLVNATIQGNRFGEETDSPDAPVIYGKGVGNFNISQVYTESSYKQGNTFIQLTNSRNASINNVRSTGGGSYLTRIASVASGTKTVTVTGTGASTLVGYLASGDIVYIFEGSGVIDGEYTVTSTASTTFTVSEDIVDDDSCFVSCLTATSPNAGEDQAPAYAVNLINAPGTKIRGLTARNARTAFINADSNSVYCTVENFCNSWYGTTPEEAWGRYASPGIVTSGAADVVFAGYGCVNLSPVRYDNSSLIRGKLERDGFTTASATKVNIKPVWGPHNKVYLTGTTTIAELDGGYVGQIVTLIGTKSVGCKITNDDSPVAAGGGIDLVGTGDFTLTDEKTIMLRCTVATAAANVWVEVGH